MQSHQIILNIFWKSKHLGIVKEIIAGAKMEQNTSPNLKLYYKAVVIKPPWHWNKDRTSDQWNKF